MSRTSNSGEINLVIDIGSLSVGGALVILGDKPEIIFSKRIRLPWSKARNEDKTEELIIQSLNELIQIILKESATVLHINQHKLESKKIKKVLCIVSSPWSISKTNVISHTHKGEKGLEITPKILDMILGKDEKGEEDKQENYMVLERKIIKVKLNGYTTDKFLGKEARDIEISVFEGKIQENFMNKIQQVFSRYINSEIIFHSYTLSALSILQEIFPEARDYSMVEITGMRTDVTLIDDGLIKSTDSFGRGTSSFLGRVSSEYDVTPDIAMSFLKIYYEKRTEENFKNRIEKIVEEEKNAWISELRKSLGDDPLPSQFLLIVDPSFLPFFEEYLKLALENRGRDFSIMFIGKSVENLCTSKNNEFDPFLFLATVFLNRI